MTKKLNGPNGSVYQQVKHIPQAEDGQGIVYYNIGGQHYRNHGGKTWKMIKRGRYTWANRKR